MVTRILYYSEGWGLGGIERFVMNTVEMLDPEEYRFDIFCTHDWSDNYDPTIKKLGGKRYTVFKGYKPNLLTRLLASTKAWAELLREGHYDVVHINTMNGVGFVYAHIARINRVPVRIVHSHNSAFGAGHSVIKSLAHKIGIRLYAKDANSKLACSKEAGEYLFGSRHFEIISNGIDTEAFAFSQDDRTAIRNTLGIPNDALVFGTVGRLSEAKNPLFQIKVLDILRKAKLNAYLLLVGEGELRSAVVKLAEELGIENYILLPGSSKAPQKYLSALDVLSMPSKYEGFPLSLIEAVGNGLACVVSESVKLEPNSMPIYFMPISSAAYWASSIRNIWEKSDTKTRIRGLSTVIEAGYSRETMSKQLTRTYALAQE